MEEEQQVQHYASKYEAIAAVVEDWTALELMSEAMKGDKDVVMAAVTEDDEALLFASKELHSNKEFILDAVKQQG